MAADSIVGDADISELTPGQKANLDAVLNDIKPDARTKKQLAGFSAHGTLKRSDFGMKYLVGAIGDDVTLRLELLGDEK